MMTRKLTIKSHIQRMVKWRGREAVSKEERVAIIGRTLNTMEEIIEGKATETDKG